MMNGVSLEQIEFRNFLLNLSPQVGQHYAASQGFIPPSRDVQQLENVDAIKNRQKLLQSGIGEYITHSAYWSLNMMRQSWWTDEYALMMYHSFVSMISSNLIVLNEAGVVQFTNEPTIELAVWDKDTKSYRPIDQDHYSYWDQIQHLDWEPDVTQLGELP